MRQGIKSIHLPATRPAPIAVIEAIYDVRISGSTDDKRKRWFECQILVRIMSRKEDLVRHK